jgi:Tol biopolymer transport system component
VVLYEMLAGQRLFTGDSIAHILADVLRASIDFDKLPKETSREIRDLLKRCLDRDVKTRLRDIGEARIAIQNVGKEPEVAATAAAPALRFGWLAWGLAGLFLLASVAVSFVHFRETPPAQPAPIRFQIPIPEKAVLASFALSPDGHFLAYVVTQAGAAHLWVRPMDSLEAKVLPGTDEASFPFWSPDNKFIGFFGQGKLKRVGLAGGPATTICDAPNGRGATWNRDGVIVFAPSNTTPLYRVAADGGAPILLNNLTTSATGYRFPWFLEDGIHFFYVTESTKPDVIGIYLGSLNGSQSVRLLPNLSIAVYVPPLTTGGSGYVLFRRESTLMAQPFDRTRLNLAGEAFSLVDQVPPVGTSGMGAFSAADNGALIYTQGVGESAERELEWIDRAGNQLGSATKPAVIDQIALSPDEKRVALVIGERARTDIWIEDLVGGKRSRLTFRSGRNRSPLWSLDGSRLAFAYSPAAGTGYEAYRKAVNGEGTEELLGPTGINGTLYDWSEDGKFILHAHDDQMTRGELWLLPLNGDHKSITYLQTPFGELNAKFSPGPGGSTRWIAYESRESGQAQIYVQGIPAGQAKWQISTMGGTQPQWRRDGKELYYVGGDQRLMAVPVKLSPTFEPGTPQPLFDIGARGASYQPTKNGQRFLVNVPAGGRTASAPSLTVVLNWQAGLKK